MAIESLGVAPLNLTNTLDGTFSKVKDASRKFYHFYMNVGEARLVPTDSICEKVFACKGNKIFHTPLEYIVEAKTLKVNPHVAEGADKNASEKESKNVADVEEEIAKINIPVVPTKVSAFENDANYLTEHQDITGKQDVISDLKDIRANAALGATALQEVPAGYVTETDLSTKGYLTNDSLNDYATKEFVGEEIEKIDIPVVPTKVSAFENDANYLTEHQSLDNYFTKAEVNKMIEDINALIGEAINITNTILA
jgi:hypothetical protein